MWVSCGSTLVCSGHPGTLAGDCGCHPARYVSVHGTIVWIAGVIKCDCGCEYYGTKRAHSPAPFWNADTEVMSHVDAHANSDNETDDISTVCGRCGDREHITTRAEVGNDLMDLCTWCYEQYRECGNCEGLAHTDDLSECGGLDEGVCYSCVANAHNIRECESCDALYNTNNWDYCCETDDDDDDRITPSSNENAVYGYSYKPSPIFKGEQTFRTNRYGGQYDATLYMGFELEVECPRGTKDDAARLMNQAGQDNLYLKRDGSINDGFEIVTHPRTLDWFMNEFPWELIRKGREDKLMRPDSSCGMHVHVSRATFGSPAHEYRWMLFWYRNQQIMEALARRKSSYAKYGVSHRATFADFVKGKGVDYADRYSAINTENEHTLEVRVFASTLFVNRLKAALQLVESTVEYTRNLASSKVLKDGGFSFMEYVAWLDSHGERYRQLLQQITALIDPSLIVPATADHDQVTYDKSYPYAPIVNKTVFRTQDKVTA